MRKVWIPHKSGFEFLHGLPADVLVEVADDPARLPSDVNGVEFWVPTFLDQPSMLPLAGSLPDLRVLQLPSVGADGWLNRVRDGVAVATARGVHEASTAEWAIGAVLASLRRFPEFVRARRWAPLPGGELFGKRVLIVGAGAIGTAVADRLAPFGVTVTRVARTPRPAEGVHGVGELPLLLPAADVVILLVPLTAGTRGLIGRRELAALPDGALVVNAARGPVVDEQALREELRSGRLSAALDVVDHDPLPAEDVLWKMANVLVTPHVGAWTTGMRDRIYRLVADQLDRYLSGRELLHRVDELHRSADIVAMP
ncbi:2-hydroxyacid dehydrogenase [Micromonospora ureilytica]|uniref:2-hydroxyacid dehydrogenase n=1 Tax=Micromonospora ureilytica TaxID=709868 RepID=UPI0033EDD835